MKKIIDIPDEIVKELKLIAVKNDTDLKNYIQNLISRQYEFTKMTELAREGIEDGQSIRFLWNYLHQTYEGIKGCSFDYGNVKFNTEIEFFEHVKEVCEELIYSIKNEEDGN